MPDPTKPFVVEADTSKWATGAVLKQQDINGDWHPCGYISHTFDITQRNYDIYNRELLGIIRALEAWRHYLKGSPHPVTVLSNHKNLTYFQTAQKLNRRQVRWSLYLWQFNLKLMHVPGTKIIQSDALSRRADLIGDEDKDNKNMTMLPSEMFIRFADTDLKDLFIKTTMREEVVQDALKAIKEKGTPPMKSTLTDWTFEEDLTSEAIVMSHRIQNSEERLWKNTIIYW